MPYIGNQPAESFTSFATQEFSTSATTSYTLDHAVTNENEIALFINNVRQQPGSGKAYTATGTALTLSAATASTDTMYCVFLGRALQTVNPAGGSIGSSQLSADAITGQTALAATPADTDELLISDAGTLKRIDFSHLKTGITEADMYRLTSGFNADQDPISSNLERVDDATFGKLGTGVTPSSGIFSFATTGLYLVKFILKGNTYGDSFYSNIYGTSDNSSYDRLAYGFLGDNYNDTAYNVITIETFFNCTNVSTHKIKFTTNGMAGGGGTQVFADTDANATCFQFIRLGDSV